MQEPESRSVPPWTIRKFQTHDAGALAKILQSSAEASQWPTESYAQLTNLPGSLALVCEEGGNVSGFLIARQVIDEAEVLNVAVLPEARRQGRASGLLATALDQFRRSGALRVFLEVRTSNQPAIAFYRKHGFTDSGRRKTYYRDPIEDALCMEQKLGPVSG